MRHWIAQLLLTWLAATALPALALDLPAGPIVKTAQMRAELLAHAPEGVAPGKPLWLGLQLQHAPGWHSYWKNPGDSGLPTELRWQLPTGATAGEPAWPTPRKFRLGELANYGYEGQVLLPVPVTVTPAFQGSELKATLHASWLVCRQECIPEEGRFEIKIAAEGSTAGHAAAFEAAAAAAPRELAPGRSQIQPEGQTLKLSLDGLPAAWRGQKIEVFPETAGLIVPGAAWTQNWEGGRWQASLPLSPDRVEGPAQVPLVLALAESAHDEAGLRMTVPVTGTWPPAAQRSEVPEALQRALATAPTTPTAPADPGTGATPGLWAALLGALAGGLILNLMPCVFPVLAIKVMAFARHADDRRAHQRSGLAYSAGVLLSFLALGGLLLALRAAGEQLGWGFQLQNPVVVAGLALLFTLVGLNLAGLFEFGRMLPSALAGLQLRHPIADAFLTGVLAVAVASPCTAPFMGAALGATISLPAAQALAVFTALGVGMALPYLAASFFPWVAHALPKPGAWMQTLRELMAFPMLATVVWLLWVLGQQSGIDAVATLLLGLLLLAWLAWALCRRGKVRALIAPLVLAGLLALIWQASDRIGSVTSGESLTSPGLTTEATLPTADRDWHAWTPDRFAQLQAAGTPVFVDYTAAWCVTCQYNKRTTLSEPGLLDAFAAEGVVLLRADWTRRDPAVTAALAAVGRNGVPTYALYRAGSRPRVFSEVLDSAEVKQALAAR